LPPLVERDNDIEALIWHFIREFDERAAVHDAARVRDDPDDPPWRRIEAITPDAFARLVGYQWPGNVRELRNVIEYAFAIGEGSVLTVDELPPELRGLPPPRGSRLQVGSMAPEDDERRDDVAAVRLLTGLLAETFTATQSEGRVVDPDEAGYRWAENHIPATDAAPARTAGEWVGKVGGLIDVLDQWGYTPELSTSSGGRVARIDLPHCPFRDLARANTEVVCGIHRGLIAGTMHQLGEQDTDVTLIPFADGDRCTAHIRRTTAFELSPSKTVDLQPDSVPDQEDSR